MELTCQGLRHPPAQPLKPHSLPSLGLTVQKPAVPCALQLWALGCLGCLLHPCCHTVGLGAGWSAVVWSRSFRVRQTGLNSARPFVSWAAASHMLAPPASPAGGCCVKAAPGPPKQAVHGAVISSHLQCFNFQPSTPRPLPRMVSDSVMFTFRFNVGRDRIFSPC